MTAREYLQQYREASRVIDRIRSEYEEQMEQVDNIRSALGGDGLPRSGEVSKKVEADAIRLADKAQELVQAEVAALEKRQDIMLTINKVEGPAADILRERYVYMNLWETVAGNVGYSIRQTFELHRRGLEAVEKILNRTTPQ